jgi:hypothetical protein
VYFKLTVEDLDRLAELSRLQADTMAENGLRQDASVPARLAERLEWAASAARRRGKDCVQLG